MLRFTKSQRVKTEIFFNFIELCNSEYYIGITKIWWYNQNVIEKICSNPGDDHFSGRLTLSMMLFPPNNNQNIVINPAAVLPQQPAVLPQEPLGEENYITPPGSPPAGPPVCPPAPRKVRQPLNIPGGNLQPGNLQNVNNNVIGGGNNGAA